ncbi:MAG TPA: ABC transporter permease subunit [Planctomycetota bacterium]|nr:ABC transporter permease subunit [Planctomycetota bacterium]
MNTAEGAIDSGVSSSASSAGEMAGRRRNPIFDRELLTLLRSRKAFALLALYVAVSVSIVLASWPRDQMSVLLQGAISRELFGLFALAQTLLLALLVPATLGGAITREKEGETLDLLLTTPLSMDRILIGKLFSGITYLGILMATSIPAVLLCFLIGGLTWADVAGLYVFLSLQALLYGVISLTCSTFFHRTHTAIINSYLAVGASGVLLWSLYGDGLNFLFSDTMTGVGIMVLGAAVVLYLVCRWRMGLPFSPVRKAMEEEDQSQQIGLVINRSQFPDNLIAPARRTRPLQDGVNPVLDKELQAEIYGSGSLFVRLVIQFGMLAALGAFLWMMAGAIRVDAVSVHPEYVYFCFMIAYVMIVGPSLATTTFSQEREFHTMESLLLTLIPRGDIVVGKFVAILRVVGALALLNTFLFLLAILLSSYNFLQIPALVLSVGSAAMFSVALGMLMSLYCRTTTVSTISTYFLLFALFVGPVLARTFLLRFFPSVSASAIDWLGYVSPFLACAKESSNAGQFVVLVPHAAALIILSLVLVGWMARSLERVARHHAERT